MLISKFIDSFCYCIKHEENKKILKVDINNNEESIPTNPQNEIIDKEKNVKENNQLCLATTVNNEGNDKEKFHTILSRNSDKGLKENLSTYSNFKLVSCSKNEYKDKINDLKRNHTVTNQNKKKKIIKLQNQTTIKKKVVIIEPNHNNENLESKGDNKKKVEDEKKKEIKEEEKKIENDEKKEENEIKENKENKIEEEKKEKIENKNENEKKEEEKEKDINKFNDCKTVGSNQNLPNLSDNNKGNIDNRMQDFQKSKAKTQNNIEKQLFKDFQNNLDNLINKCLLKKKISESDDSEN